MAHRFNGTYEELQQKLLHLKGSGEWRKLNLNQMQFLHSNGGIMNWYPSTGTINFQGSSEGKKELEEIVGTCLQTSQKDASIEREIKSSRTGETTVSKEGPPVQQKEEGTKPKNQFLGYEFKDSEIVIGLVGAVGTPLEKVARVLEDRLKVSGYTVQNVSISSDIIQEYATVGESSDEYERISRLMDAGNKLRKDSGDDSILALGCAAWISSKRKEDDDGVPKYLPRKAFIVKSLKHPEEVVRFREIYAHGFFLVGVYSDIDI